MAIATQRLDPFHYLLEMAQQSRREQVSTTKLQSNDSDMIRVFRVRDLYCVFSPEVTFSVGTAQRIVQVPFVKPFIVGMVQKEHQLVPVIDMSIILGSTTNLSGTSKSRLLFMKIRQFHFAMLVDELLEEFLPKSLCPRHANSTINPSQFPVYIAAKIQYEGRIYLQLSCQAVERINDEY